MAREPRDRLQVMVSTFCDSLLSHPEMIDSLHAAVLENWKIVRHTRQWLFTLFRIFHQLMKFKPFPSRMRFCITARMLRKQQRPSKIPSSERSSFPTNDFLALFCIHLYPQKPSSEYFTFNKLLTSQLLIFIHGYQFFSSSTYLFVYQPTRRASTFTSEKDKLKSSFFLISFPILTFLL